MGPHPEVAVRLTSRRLTQSGLITFALLVGGLAWGSNAKADGDGSQPYPSPQSYPALALVADAGSFLQVGMMVLDVTLL